MRTYLFSLVIIFLCASSSPAISQNHESKKKELPGKKDYAPTLLSVNSPMKLFFPFLLFLLLVACNSPEDSTRLLQTQIDSLQRRLNNSYKPGLGEFMSDIQVHHAKLWFAGMAGNWSLSDFEKKEILESIEDIQTYCANRPEVVSIPIIEPALDSIDLAIRNKSIPQFKSAFNLLTSACNSCHRATKHEFNVIQIPSRSPFSNQDFSIQRNK